MATKAAKKRRARALQRARFAERFRDWHLPLPRPLWERLRLVRALDGRPTTEWARAVLSAAADDVLFDSGTRLRLRPDSPLYRMASDGSLSAPLSRSVGGERVFVIERLAGLPKGLSGAPTCDGEGYFCDLVAEPQVGGMHRGVVVFAADVLAGPANRMRPGGGGHL